MTDTGKPVLDEPGFCSFLRNTDAEADDLPIKPLIELFAGFQTINFGLSAGQAP
jgi:hypothetical protein